MSFSKNPAARGQLKGWFRAHGHNREVRSIAGKFYLPAEPATNPEGRAVAASAEPSDSKNLPATGATPDAGQLPVVRKSSLP